MRSPLNSESSKWEYSGEVRRYFCIEVNVLRLAQPLNLKGGCSC